MNTEQGRETSPVGRVAFKAMEGRLASLVGSTPASSATSMSRDVGPCGA